MFLSENFLEIGSPPPHGSSTASHWCSGSVPCTHQHSNTGPSTQPPRRAHAHHHTGPCPYVHRHSQFTTQPPLLHSRAVKKDNAIYRSFSKSKKQRRQIAFMNIVGYNWRLTSNASLHHRHLFRSQYLWHRN